MQAEMEGMRTSTMRAGSWAAPREQCALIHDARGHTGSFTCSGEEVTVLVKLSNTVCTSCAALCGLALTAAAGEGDEAARAHEHDSCGGESGAARLLLRKLGGACMRRDCCADGWI
jgi:hypothetical protein